eukprot:jgi/Tetstr1/426056/TSEL_001611.t1
MPKALFVRMIRALAAVSLLLLVSAAHAQAEKPYEPARGTQERKDLMNAIRPLRPGGKPIDLSATALREQADYMDGITTYALLVRAYGRWNIVDYAIGPTDVFWSGDPLYDQLTPGLVPR